MQVTNEMIEAACKAHAPQWDNIDPELQIYGRYQMKTAIEAALAASDTMQKFCKFVDKVENRALHSDGPVTPFIEEIAKHEHDEFHAILNAIYS